MNTLCVLLTGMAFLQVPAGEAGGAACQSTPTSWLCDSGDCGDFVCFHKLCCSKFFCAWHTTGNMYQHYPYYPSDHGYYYHRPYNAIHVVEDQLLAPLLQGDPRMPYATLQFQEFYAQLNVGPVAQLPGPDGGMLSPLPRMSRKLPSLEDLLD